MSTSQELNYRLYLQRSEQFTRTDLKSEFDRYNAIRNGDVKLTEANFQTIRQDYLKGKGILSLDPLRNHIYHFVVSAGIIARVCIDAGLPHNEGYTLSDIYIRKADLCKQPEEVIDLLGQMQLDFASRMQDIHRHKEVSLHIRHAIDYIYDHLQDPLTMEQLAEQEHLNPSYFSKLFHREIGQTVKAFILRCKLATAQNMLQQSEYSIADIALSLGFSSQSAFTCAFRKQFHTTPGVYRSRYPYSQMLDTDPAHIVHR